VTRPFTKQAVTNRRQTTAGGFTLPEVLVALALLGLVLTMLTGAIRLGLGSRQTTAEVDARASEMEAAVRAMRLVFARAEPGDLNAPEPVFVGTEHAVSFVSQVPDGRDGLRTADVRLFVSAARRLELSWRPHARRWLVTPPLPGADPLLDGVEQLDLAYWQEAGGRWVTGWRDIEPPRLVRLRVIFPAGDHRHWPDIIAAPARQAIRP
jgi:general secretion pathway protein J